MNTQNKNKIEFGQDQIHRIHKHHVIRKIVEIALFCTLFIFSASLAKAAPITAENVELLINNERVERGISPLRINSKLDLAAENKSIDMIARNYFEHYALGLTPWDFIKNQGYDYLYAGENLAMDFQTSENMVNAWMNSETHRKNILNPDYNEMGIGIVKGEFTDSKGKHETIMVTNMFASEKPAIIRLFDAIVDKIKSTF